MHSNLFTRFCFRQRIHNWKLKKILRQLGFLLGSLFSINVSIIKRHKPYILTLLATTVVQYTINYLRNSQHWPGNNMYNQQKC